MSRIYSNQLSLGCDECGSPKLMWEDVVEGNDRG